MQHTTRCKRGTLNGTTQQQGEVQFGSFSVLECVPVILCEDHVVFFPHQPPLCKTSHPCNVSLRNKGSAGTVPSSTSTSLVPLAGYVKGFLLRQVPVYVMYTWITALKSLVFKWWKIHRYKRCTYDHANWATSKKKVPFIADSVFKPNPHQILFVSTCCTELKVDWRWLKVTSFVGM